MAEPGIAISVSVRCGRLFFTCSAPHVFSSPEPKAHGELIVYQSSWRPSVRSHF